LSRCCTSGIALIGCHCHLFRISMAARGALTLARISASVNSRSCCCNGSID
jgi:hypothetical protein